MVGSPTVSSALGCYPPIHHRTWGWNDESNIRGSMDPCWNIKGWRKCSYCWWFRHPAITTWDIETLQKMGETTYQPSNWCRISSIDCISHEKISSSFVVEPLVHLCVLLKVKPLRSAKLKWILVVFCLLFKKEIWNAPLEMLCPLLPVFLYIPYVPFGELVYPTAGKGKSSSKQCLGKGYDILRRVWGISFDVHQRYPNPPMILGGLAS